MKHTYKPIIIAVSILVILILSLFLFSDYFNSTKNENLNSNNLTLNNEIVNDLELIDTDKKEEISIDNASHPMSIKALRANEYIGGDFIIKEELENGYNYKRYIASYKSEDLEINGLLTVPLMEMPESGFPAVIFVHGYIPPKEYSTISSYPTYQASLARAGFVTYKPDLRGHDESEGEAVSAHFSEKYVIDTMNAIEYLKDYEAVNENMLAYWGHSNGGEIGLKVVLLSDDIKAASFWAGVVGSYEDMLETYNDDIPFLQDLSHRLIQENDLPSENPEFWNKLEPHNYLADIIAPIEIQHSTGDDSVPIELSLSLKKALEEEGKVVEYHQYQGGDHNIGQNSNLAWQRTIDFFNRHLDY
jgi:dipeptidyl aminopeptidase/acylaminoacyl peptidase